jgi:hypothetical protein
MDLILDNPTAKDARGRRAKSEQHIKNTTSPPTLMRGHRTSHNTEQRWQRSSITPMATP